MKSWSDLSNDLVTSIGKRLDTSIDVLRFRAVCTSWRSAFPLSHYKKNSPRFPIKLPRLIALSSDHNNPAILSLTESIVYRFEPLHDDRDDKTSSSNSGGGGGCLVKVEESTKHPGTFFLLNPLSRHRILNNSDTFANNLNLLDYRVFEVNKAYALKHLGKYLDIEKTIFCADEPPSVLVLYVGQLSYIRKGDEEWTHFGFPSGFSIIPLFANPDAFNYYTDIMLYKGKFHAIDGLGQVYLLDSVTMKFTPVSHQLIISNGPSKKYLVQNSGDLYVVDHYIDTTEGVKFDFEIYKLNEADHNLPWINVKSLVDQVVFLGKDCSFLASAERLAGCRGNCIYFSDSNNVYHHSKKDGQVLKGLHCHDTTLFNLEDRSTSGIATRPDSFQVILPPPIPISFKSNNVRTSILSQPKRLWMDWCKFVQGHQNS